MPKLIFTQPEFAAQTCELPEGKTTVGRGPRNTLVIRDDTVSADHCELLVSWNEVIVRERGSRNGTWAGGVRVDASGQRPVNHGETIRFGRVEARLELAESLTDHATANTANFVMANAPRTGPAAPPGRAVVQPEGLPPAAGADVGGTLLVPVPPAPVAAVTGHPDRPTRSAAVPSRGWPVRRGLLAALVGLAAGAALVGAWLWWRSR